MKFEQAAQITEEHLEFLENREHCVTLSVVYALEDEQPLLAFEAIQDAKGVLVASAREHYELWTRELSEHEQTAKNSLCHWLDTEQTVFTQQERNRLLEEIPEKDKDRIADAEWETSQVVQQETRRRAERYFNLGRAFSSRPQVDWSNYPDNPVDISSIQNALPEHWALLDFWQAWEDRYVVFIVTQRSFQHVTLDFPCDDREVLQAWEDLYGWFKTGQGARVDALFTLHDFQFAPLRDHLEGFFGFLVVPADDLHHVPFHALTAEEGHYLCDEFDIAYLPSAAVLPQLSPLGRNGAMLSLVNPERGTENTLPFSEWEADHLQQQLRFPEHEIYAGPDATIDKLQQWELFPIVHFSCHGVGNEFYAPLSRLHLCGEPLLAHEVRYRQPPLPNGALVILNGCETAVRDVRAVNESSGLMSSFLARGAGLVLATSWSVVDACASEMVTTFLTSLVKDQRSPSESLRVAQRRARTITCEEVEARCQYLLKHKFPESDFPYEAACLNAEGLKACQKGGNCRGIKHYATKAASNFRRLKQHKQVATNEALTDQLPETTELNMARVMFDHPVYWSAFHLFGRVT